MYICTTFCLFTHLLMDTWVVYTFWLGWLMLLWTWIYKYLSQSLLSVSSFGRIPRCAFAKLHGDFMRNHRAVFHSSRPFFHSHTGSTFFAFSSALILSLPSSLKLEGNWSDFCVVMSSAGTCDECWSLSLWEDHSLLVNKHKRKVKVELIQQKGS